MKKKLETLSNTDPLTGIHNRRYFMESVIQQMDRVVRMNSESYIIMFDLDHFKEINDRYGHRSGDMVLSEISTRVAETMRSHDLFVRYGGEEFIIFVADVDKDSTMQIAESIRRNITETPIKIKGGSVSITVSLGIAPAAPVNNLETALELSDNALYRAKGEGRNRSIFLRSSPV